MRKTYRDRYKQRDRQTHGHINTQKKDIHKDVLVQE